MEKEGNSDTIVLYYEFFRGLVRGLVYVKFIIELKLKPKIASCL